VLQKKLYLNSVLKKEISNWRASVGQDVRAEGRRENYTETASERSKKMQAVSDLISEEGGKKERGRGTRVLSSKTDMES